MVGDEAVPGAAKTERPGGDARGEGSHGEGSRGLAGWRPPSRAVRAVAFLVGLMVPPVGALAMLSGSSRPYFVALVGSSLLPAAIWAVGSLPGRAVPRGTTTALLVAWSWLAEASYLNRYRPSWPLSEYDPVIVDLPIVVAVCAVVIGQRVARRRRRPEPAEESGTPSMVRSPSRTASLAGLIALAALWWALALTVAVSTETPPDDVGVVLGLPAGDLVVATGPDGWACSAAGEYCNAAAGVASTDDLDSAQVQIRLERHLRARGWQHPADEQLHKGLLWHVPMHVEIRRMTSTAVTVIVFWGAEPAAAVSQPR